MMGTNDHSKRDGSGEPGQLLADLDFVRRLAHSLCADPAAADDAASQAAAAARREHAALAELPSESRRGWLHVVTRNLPATSSAPNAGDAAMSAKPRADAAPRPPHRHTMSRSARSCDDEKAI
ncbi:MAG: hypothetical protein AB8H80_23030 [Planctomycetota bacterium]